MKKIYISADIEGIWGNSNPANTAKNGYLYSEYCTNMMNEVNLVIDLLFQNGGEDKLNALLDCSNDRYSVYKMWYYGKYRNTSGSF